MSSSWRQRIESLGGVVAEGGALRFADPWDEARTADAGTVAVPLVDRVLIALSGERAEGFLQTQLTCDVGRAGESASTLGAYCNPKGRVISVFRVFRWGERFVLDVLADAADATEKRLTLYRMRTPVTIERLDEVASIGVSGPAAGETVEAAGLPAPAPGEVATADGGAVIVLGLPAAGSSRYAVHAPAGRGGDLLEALSRGISLAGSAAWRLHAIRAGELDLAPALSEVFTANMLNLFELGAVQFEKGCFPGQEVVARTHHLGKAPRRLRHAVAPASEVPAPGAKLRAFRGEQARDAGVVVEAAPGAEGRIEMLAVLAEAQMDADAIRLGEEDGGPALQQVRDVDRLGA